MDIEIHDDSGDKKYFTIIPNYVLNHSTAVAQALYLQLKRLAGEKGVAYPSRGWLMKQLGITKPTLLKEFSYLVKRGWIKEIGTAPIKTKGGQQSTKAYKIIDLWDLNNDYYKGVKNNTPLDTKGVKNNSQGGKENVAKGVKNKPTKKIHYEEEPMKKKVLSASQTTKTFEEFYDAYPKKEKRKQSLAIWKSKRLGEKLPRILDFVEKAKKTDRWKGGFIKQPTAFLNGECWDDDLSSYGDNGELKTSKYKTYLPKKGGVENGH